MSIGRRNWYAEYDESPSVSLNSIDYLKSMSQDVCDNFTKEDQAE